MDGGRSGQRRNAGVAVESIVSIENAAPEVSVSLVPTFTALDDLMMVLNASDADGDTATVESVRWYLNDGLQSATPPTPRPLLH